MSLEQGTAPAPVAWFGNRNFIVPPEITPVRRVSPLPKRKRTPWRARPDGDPICRSGNRDWFSDRLFVDPHGSDLRTACGTSTVVHASCLVSVLMLLASQPAPAERPARVSEPLRMPAFVAMIEPAGGGGGHPGPPLTAAVERPAAPASQRPARAIEAAARRLTAPPDVAAERLPDIEPLEAATESKKHESKSDVDVMTPPDALVAAPGASIAGTAGTDTAGTGSGPGNGNGNGSGGGTHGTGDAAGVAVSPGPYRLGKGIEPPRKIKEVRPIFPPDATTLRASGTVAIEAVVGADGLVHDARVIHSIPVLDQAALDAVRQWQFMPARLNGAAVAVIVTILVQFSIH